MPSGRASGPDSAVRGGNRSHTVGANPRSGLAEHAHHVVVQDVTFLIALLLTTVVGAEATALGASAAFYLAWTKARSTPRC